MVLAFDIKDFFHNFLIYHYLFFIILFLVALFLLFMGIALRRKLFLAFIFYITSFLTITVAPVTGSYYLEEYLRKTSLENIKVSRLVYTKAIVITANLTNKGKIPIKKSYIVLSMVKKNNNSILEFFNTFSPAASQKIFLQIPIKPGENSEVRFVFDISKVNAPALYDVYYVVKSF